MQLHFVTFGILLLHCFYGFATANMGATVGQKYGKQQRI
jgi:hypothetical protein